MSDGNSIEADRLARKETFRCRRCYLPMQRVPRPADDGHHIAQAAAYYGDGEQP